MAYVNPFDQVNKRPTIYDGIGNKTTPYHTQYYQANRRWVRFHAKFYTQNAGYDAYYTVGRRDTRNGGNTDNDQLTTPSLEHEFDRELMGFDTSNQGDKSQPTMNIYLFGFRDWEQLLQVNDYAALIVSECYPDSKAWLQEQKEDPYSDNGVETRTLMTGLISNIHISEDSQSQGRTYTITCQGMQKILSNINLGLPKTAEIGSTNLLFDINGESNPANEQYPFGTVSSGPSKSTNTKGGGAYGLSGVPGEIAKYLSGKGYTKAQIAGAIGNAVQESGLNPKESGGGLWQNTSGASGSVASQTAAVIAKDDPSHSFKSKTSSSGPTDCAKVWCDIVERPAGAYANLPHRESAAESYYKKMK